MQTPTHITPEQDRRIYQQHLFTAFRHYCIAVTGKCHVYTFPVFFEKYEILKRYARDYNGFRYVQLDISDEAVRDLEFFEDGIYFLASINGVDQEIYLAFDQMLGLNNNRDHVIHRIVLAATSNLHHGLDPRTLVMMDWTTCQDPGKIYQDASPPPVNTPRPEVKRPTLAIVK